jgi:hypothetical protein
LQLPHFFLRENQGLAFLRERHAPLKRKRGTKVYLFRERKSRHRVLASSAVTLRSATSPVFLEVGDRIAHKANQCKGLGELQGMVFGARSSRVATPSPPLRQSDIP